MGEGIRICTDIRWDEMRGMKTWEIVKKLELDLLNA